MVLGLVEHFHSPNLTNEAIMDKHYQEKVQKFHLMPLKIGLVVVLVQEDILIQ